MPLLIFAYIADLAFGDPERFPHPVRWIGALITFLDNKLRGNGPVFTERLKGAIMAIAVIGVSASLTYLFIKAAAKINPILGYVAWIYAAYTTIAARDLHDRARAISNRLSSGSVADARQKLSGIVSRNTAELDEDGIVISVVESVAENTADGIVAPLFYLALGGPVLAMAYKAVNTLDSMVGYKNEKYKDFGWFSAKMDDAVNYIPARICGALISMASFISGSGFRKPFKTMLRDGRKHPSPNSGISEAAMAGAVRIRLGGTWSYDGKEASKPFLGDREGPPQISMIGTAIRISFIVSLLMVTMGALYRCIV